jgi:hypothetical protein
VDDNWAYFGGNVEEITQAFTDLGVPDVVFTHVQSTEDPDHFGFDYFTSDPGFDEVGPMPDPMTRQEMIQFLAGSVTKMTISPDKVQFNRTSNRLIWNFRSVTELGIGTLLTTLLFDINKNIRYVPYTGAGSVLKH